jgi:hypothetical protein
VVTGGYGGYGSSPFLARWPPWRGGPWTRPTTSTRPSSVRLPVRRVLDPFPCRHGLHQNAPMAPRGSSPIFCGGRRLVGRRLHCAGRPRSHRHGICTTVHDTPFLIFSISERVEQARPGDIKGVNPHQALQPTQTYMLERRELEAAWYVPCRAARTSLASADVGPLPAVTVPDRRVSRPFEHTQNSVCSNCLASGT